jgi:hypothetical protein
MGKSYAWDDLPKEDYKPISRLDLSEKKQFASELVEVFNQSAYELDLDYDLFFKSLINRHPKLSRSKALCAIWMGVTGQLCRVYDKVRLHDILARDGFISEFYKYQAERKC